MTKTSIGNFEREMESVNEMCIELVEKTLDGSCYYFDYKNEQFDY